MTAQEVINLAKNGELKQLAVKDDIAAVLGFINLGLVELYKRFPIVQKEYLIEVVDKITYYDLPQDFMWVVEAYQYAKPSQTTNTTMCNNSPNVPVALIELPINQPEDALSISVVGTRSVQIANRCVGDVVSIVYTAAPKTVTIDTLDKELPIPVQMVEALLNYVGYRGHGSVNGNINAESNTHYKRFEVSVQRIIIEGMVNSEGIDMPFRIHDKGFV